MSPAHTAGRFSASGKPLKVALIHNIISPHVVPLFARLAQQPGIRLKVYFLASGDLNRRWETDAGQNFCYEVLSHVALRVGRRDVHTFFINPTIIPTLRRDGFDVIISAGWDSLAAQSAFLMCRMLHKPFILWSGSTANEPSWRRSLTLPLVRTMVRGSSGWIAYGSRAREYLVDLGADPEGVRLAYNTVDVEWFASQADALRPDRDRIRHGLGLNGRPTVLYVGQLIERKGLHDLLAACSILAKTRPSVQLVLVGYGPLAGALRQEVERLSLPRVTLTDHVPIGRLPHYYVAADCFVLPSHEEVWGLVLNEAAACGLPLVTTDAVGAGPDLVLPGTTGFVVPPGQPAGLATALMQALDRPELGQAARKRVRAMTYEQNVRAFLESLDKSAANPGGSFVPRC